MSERADLQRSNRALLARLCVVVLAMFGFGFALVPFYEKICEVTGLRDIARGFIYACEDEIFLD